jgi:hypothetical protein
LSLLPIPALGIERTEDRINSFPPFMGDVCWVTNHLAFDIPDTLCYDLIWNWSGFRAGDIVGMSYLTDPPCDSHCATLDQICIYFPDALTGPGDEVRIRVFCADSTGAPTGDELTAIDLDPHRGTETVSFDGLSLAGCVQNDALRFVITLCWLTDSGYPHIATDNMQTISELGCAFPPGYPRSSESDVRSRIFDVTAACDPEGNGRVFHDDLDNLELIWSVGLTCTPPDPIVPVSWGKVKGLFRK